MRCSAVILPLSELNVVESTKEFEWWRERDNLYAFAFQNRQCTRVDLPRGAHCSRPSRYRAWPWFAFWPVRRGDQISRPGLFVWPACRGSQHLSLASRTKRPTVSDINNRSRGMSELCNVRVCSTHTSNCRVPTKLPVSIFGRYIASEHDSLINLALAAAASYNQRSAEAADLELS